MMTNENTLVYILKKILGVFTALIVFGTAAIMPTGKAGAAQVAESELKDMANEICFLVNELRAENGLNSVYVVPYLNDIAATRAREITQVFNHKRPDGSKFSTIIDDNLVPYYAAYENIAAGNSTPEETMEQWKNSEKHLDSILNPNITHMGVGCTYEQNSEYGWYWELTFVDCDQDLPGQYIPSRHTVTPQAEGDITGDGVINSYDYLALLDYLYKKTNGTPVYFNDAQLATADCFRDGLITESDAKVMMRYILGEYKTLPYVF